MWHVCIRSKWMVFGAGLLIGGAAAPVIRLGVRPLVLGVVKAAILLQREGRTVVEGIQEELEDIVAEARSEIEKTLPPEGCGHEHRRGQRETSERTA